MVILNAFTEEVLKEACFQCEYKGYTISVSNVSGRHELLVFKGGLSFPNIPNMEQAIAFIEEQIAPVQ